MACMKSRPGICLVTSGILIFLSVASILIGTSFPSVEYYQMGFVMSRTTGVVEVNRVYESGRHAIGPDKTFKTFLKSIHDEEFSLAKVSTSDRLEIGLTTHFQYFLRPHQLGILHEKFDRYYRPIYRRNALDALKNAAVYYSTREYIREREKVENALEEAVRERLTGKCCAKGCQSNPKYKCLPNCIPYDNCGKEDYGLFVDMPLFQLTRVQIPKKLTERFQNALLLHEKNDEAKLLQEGAVLRKQTDQQVREITNLANRLQRAAEANATLTRKIATAEAKVMVESARAAGLKHLYTSLNITQEKHKVAFHYLRTLNRKAQIKLALDFESYIAGDLKK